MYPSIVRLMDIVNHQFRLAARPVGLPKPSDWTYTDNVAEIWWNPTAPDPTGQNSQPGAYEYVRGGQRYRVGELPKEDPLVFKDGVTTPPDNGDITD